MGTHARNTDPVSSHEAAARNSIIRDSQITQVAAMVKERPGQTSAELGQIFRADRYMIARRLSDAAKKGLLERGDHRTCAVSDRSAVTWWPV